METLYSLPKYARKVIVQENVIKSLGPDLEDALNDSEEVCETNKHLEKVVDTLHSTIKDTENVT